MNTSYNPEKNIWQKVKKKSRKHGEGPKPF